MREIIEERLGPLRGLPLMSVGRGADMAWFQFGQKRTILDTRGNPKTVGDYALHILAAWRLTGMLGTILLQSNHIYLPATTQSGRCFDFDWDVPGANRFDEQVDHLLKDKNLRFIVADVHADSDGGLKILFQDGSVLEAFADSSQNEELWRFFVPGRRQPHLVIGKGGLQTSQPDSL